MHSFDFLIIGSGIAGLTTALSLAPHGSVLVVSKGELIGGSTNLAQGGIAAVVQPGDTIASHIHDTLVAGAFHNNKAAVEVLIEQGPLAIAWLESQGVVFDRKNDTYATSFEAAHAYPRVLHITDLTGRELEKSLLAACKKFPSITLWEQTTAVDLILNKKKCIGASFIKNKKVFPVAAHATILATGGVGQLYEWTTNPVGSTGDGIALAHRVGAKLADLEFVQFHPTALQTNISPLFLISEALRGEGAYLKKVKSQKSKVKITDGQRFMHTIDPRGELAPRDVVARAIFNEQQQGYIVFLDMRHKGEKFLQKRFPNIYAGVKKRGFDLASDLVPVTPAAHFMCGGIATDLWGKTSIDNLFAVGETAATGVHGANRLASNSLLEGVVFGRRIARYLKNITTKPFARGPLANVDVTSRYSNQNSNQLLKLKKHIKEIMWEKVGIIRTAHNLTRAITELKNINSQLKSYNQISEDLIEVKNMAQTALLIAQAALARKESLGAHYIKA